MIIGYFSLHSGVSSNLVNKSFRKLFNISLKLTLREKLELLDNIHFIAKYFEFPKRYNYLL